MRPRLTLPALALSGALVPGCASRSPHSGSHELGLQGPALRVSASPTLALDEPPPARPSTLAPLSARVEVGDGVELPLEAMDVQVRVDGFRARVLVDVDFTNPGPTALEGTFQLRLPDDASPYFLAFGPHTTQVGGPPPPARGAFAPEQIVADRGSLGIALKEAKLVARSAAAAAYTETVRPERARVIVDPALVEWSGAGVYSARVFPLTEGARHRVTIGYDVDLTPVGADLELRLPVTPRIPKVRIAVDTHAPTPGDVVVEPRLPAIREGDRLRYRVEDPDFEALTLRLLDRGALLLHGDDPETGPYFAARFTPDLPAGPAVQGRPRAVLLVDASMSSGPRWGLWRGLLREILTRNRDELREFAVVFFNVEARWWRPGFVANTPENVEAALAFADTVALEGATDLGAALAEARSPAWAPTDAGAWDLFLLSDGAATWGEPDAFAIARRLREHPGTLHAYRTHGAGVDPRVLGILTRETGGSLLSVASASEIEAVARAHRRRPWELVGVEVSGGEDVLIAGRPQALVPGLALELAGRGAPTVGARVALRVRQGAIERTIGARLGAPIASELTPRIYGQIAVAQLEEAIDAARVDAEAYARHFRVAGAACSLLMLESEEDYARFGLDAAPQGAPRVRERPVRGTLAAVAGRLAEDRGSARASVLRELAGFTAATGIVVDLDPRILPLVESSDPAAFEVPSAPLSTVSSSWQEIPAWLRPVLVEQRPDAARLVVEADARRTRWSPGDGLKALSSLIEARPGDDAELRELALVALAWGQPDAARSLLQRSADLPPFDPESHHLLAVAYAEIARIEWAIVHFELALGGRWGDRYAAARPAIIHDYRRLLATAERLARPEVAEFARARRGELSGTPTGALVVQLQWSRDDTDLDLHVVEPEGADCSYAAPATPAGGELLLDATDGYGPELYVRSAAAPGTYRIGVKQFSGARHRAESRTRALVTVYRDSGGARELVTRHTVTLEPGKAVVPVATVEIR